VSAVRRLQQVRHSADNCVREGPGASPTLPSVLPALAPFDRGEVHPAVVLTRRQPYAALFRQSRTTLPTPSLDPASRVPERQQVRYASETTTCRRDQRHDGFLECRRCCRRRHPAGNSTVRPAPRSHARCLRGAGRGGQRAATTHPIFNERVSACYTPKHVAGRIGVGNAIRPAPSSLNGFRGHVSVPLWARFIKPRTQGDEATVAGQRPCLSTTEPSVLAVLSLQTATSTECNHLA